MADTNDWLQRYPKDKWIGLRVRVVGTANEESPGDGEIICFGPLGSPGIMLDNGKMIYGFECWWLPVEVAEAQSQEPQVE